MDFCPDCDATLAVPDHCGMCGWRKVLKPDIAPTDWYQYEVIHSTPNNFRQKWREYCEANGLGDKDPPLKHCGPLRWAGEMTHNREKK